jgi:hypothetical protein
MNNKMEKFKNIIGKLPDDIFKIVCSYSLPSNKEYIFKQYYCSYVVKILNYGKTNDNIGYAIKKLDNKLQMEERILCNLIDNDLPSTEKDYSDNLKKTLKKIIRSVVSKSIYIDDKKLNEIINVYVKNIDIINIKKYNLQKLKIIWIFNKIRNYKLLKNLILLN